MARKTLASAFVAVTMAASGMLPAARATNDRDVRITYAEENGTVKTSSFDLLVVACDPAALSGILDGKTALEERVETALERYTLGTSLWDVRRKEGEGNRYTIRMSPDQLSASDGDGESRVVNYRANLRAVEGHITAAYRGRKLLEAVIVGINTVCLIQY